MTIIAVKSGVMAADSHSFSDGTSFPCGFPKITRGPRGLIGIAGESNDCYRVSLWWKDGGEGDIPGLRQHHDSIADLILKPDGSVWFMDERLIPHPVTEPATTGEPDAATFTEGALHAGLSAEDAVRLAIIHCKSAGGEVQVERLHPEEVRASPLPFLVGEGAPMHPDQLDVSEDADPVAVAAWRKRQIEAYDRYWMSKGITPPASISTPGAP